jgi:hypothetical protein
MADNRGAAVSERDQYVAHARRIGPQRVVAARLGRLAVAEQVGRDHCVVLSQDPSHGIPLSGASGDPVNEQDYRVSGAGGAIAHTVAVEEDFALIGFMLGEARLPSGVGGMGGCGGGADG